MDFQDIQAGVVENVKRYCEKYNLEMDEDFALIKLYEEVGEFAQAILIHRRKHRPEKLVSEAEAKEELAKELADVIGVALFNAHILDLDLEAALKTKWLKLPPSQKEE